MRLALLRIETENHRIDNGERGAYASRQYPLG